MEKLFIKNMVCHRCKAVVQSELEKLNLHPVEIELGEVQLREEIDGQTRDKIEQALKPHGFQLLDDKRSRVMEKIKNIIIYLVHHAHERLKVKLSAHISSQLNMDYTYISNLFAAVEGTTIEQYFISQKIERVKELLVYDELSISEIADLLEYSSVSHLSKQFKKVTGLTPSHFKQVKQLKRLSLDEL